MSWIPERAGNWLLHCHMIAHATPALRFWAPATSDHGHATHTSHDATTGMAGLVIGIRVSGRNPAAATPTAAPPRQLTLAMHRRPGHWAPEDAYGFALASGTTAPGPEDVSVPGPVLILTRGEPVEITLTEQSAGSDGDSLARHRARQLLRRRAWVGRRRCEHDACD